MVSDFTSLKTTRIHAICPFVCHFSVGRVVLHTQIAIISLGFFLVKAPSNPYSGCAEFYKKELLFFTTLLLNFALPQRWDYTQCKWWSSHDFIAYLPKSHLFCLGQLPASLTKELFASSFAPAVVDGFYCLCNPGYAGVSCEKDIDDCISNVCENNSTCIDFHLVSLERCFKSMCTSGN